MSSIYTHNINDYTSEIVVNNKKFIVTDHEVRKKIRHDEIKAKRRKIGNLIHKTAVIIGMLAAFYILGIVGHSDYCVEAGIADKWSMWDYIIRTVISFVIIGICTKASNFGIEMRGYYVDWEEEK